MTKTLRIAMIVLITLVMGLARSPINADNGLSGLSVDGVSLGMGKDNVLSSFGVPVHTEKAVKGYGYRYRQLNGADILSYPGTRIGIDHTSGVFWIEGTSLKMGDKMVCERGNTRSEALQSIERILGAPDSIVDHSSFEPNESAMEWIRDDTLVQVIAVKDSVVTCTLSKQIRK